MKHTVTLYLAATRTNGRYFTLDAADVSDTDWRGGARLYELPDGFQAVQAGEGGYIHDTRGYACTLETVLDGSGCLYPMLISRKGSFRLPLAKEVG